MSEARGRMRRGDRHVHLAALSAPHDQMELVHEFERRLRRGPLEPPHELSLEPLVSALTPAPSLHAPVE